MLSMNVTLAAISTQRIRLWNAELLGELADGHLPRSQQAEDLKPRGIGKYLAKIGVQLQYLFLHGRLVSPLFIFHRKYFSNWTFSNFAQTVFFIYELCLGGSTGYAFMYAAVLPMSMRQTTPSSSAGEGSCR